MKQSVKLFTNVNPLLWKRPLSISWSEHCCRRVIAIGRGEGWWICQLVTRLYQLQYHIPSRSGPSSTLHSSLPITATHITVIPDLFVFINVRYCTAISHWIYVIFYVCVCLQSVMWSLMFVECRCWHLLFVVGKANQQSADLYLADGEGVVPR